MPNNALIAILIRQAIVAKRTAMAKREIKKGGIKPKDWPQKLCWKSGVL